MQASASVDIEAGVAWEAGAGGADAGTEAAAGAAGAAPEATPGVTWCGTYRCAPSPNYYITIGGQWQTDQDAGQECDDARGVSCNRGQSCCVYATTPGGGFSINCDLRCH